MAGAVAAALLFCTAGAARAVGDPDVEQGDGAIFHQRLVDLLALDVVAAGEDAVQLLETGLGVEVEEDVALRAETGPGAADKLADALIAGESRGFCFVVGPGLAAALEGDRAPAVGAREVDAVLGDRQVAVDNDVVAEPILHLRRGKSGGPHPVVAQREVCVPVDELVEVVAAVLGEAGVGVGDVGDVTDVRGWWLGDRGGGLLFV